MVGSIIGAGISAASTLGSSYLTNRATAQQNALNLQYQREANAANIKNQWDIFDKQIDLANTAHQREVADLKAAGLNPILSASGGNGAPVVSMSPTEQNAARADGMATAAAQLSGLSQIANIINQGKMADAAVGQSSAANINAQTNAWQLYDAKESGVAGFKVLGFGGGGEVRTVRSVRINKVTGECYTLDGQRVKMLGETKKSKDGHVYVHQLEPVKSKARRAADYAADNMWRTGR